MLCPSSPLPQTETPGNALILTVPSYVGLAGALALDGSTSSGTPAAQVSQRVNATDTIFTETRVANGALTTFGQLGGGGLLTLNQSFNMAAAIDGTSNVIVVSETSDYFFSAGTSTTPVRRRIDGSYMATSNTAGFGGRWFAGARIPSIPPTALSPNPAANNQKVFNITTIRGYPFPPGAPPCVGFNGKGVNVALANTNSFAQGIGANALNNPLLSAHPNVVLAVFMDGHTQAITKTTHVTVVKRLATRDDGQNFGAEF